MDSLAFVDIALPEPRWDVGDVFADNLLFPLDGEGVDEDDCRVLFDMPTPPMSFGSPVSFIDDSSLQSLLDLATFNKLGSVDRAGPADFVYATPLATPAQSVPSSPQLSPTRAHHHPPIAVHDAVTSAECIEPSKLLQAEIQDDSDSEIDVVTVDDDTRTSSAHQPLAGLKRMWTDPQVAFAPVKLPLAQKPATEAGTKKAKTSGSSSSSACGSSSSSDGESVSGKAVDVETRRHVHNVLERRRREDLKASFDGLRAAVPDLEPNDKSPKVAILTGATEHILKLKARQQELLMAKDMYTADNARLMGKLRLLQAQLSAFSL